MTVGELRNDRAYEGAACRKGTLCDFKRLETQVDALVDTCVICHKKVIYNIRKGRMDEAKYARDHVRDFLQRGSTAFEQIYGKRAPEKRQKTKEEVMEELRYETAEALRINSRLEAKGKL